MKPLVVPIPLPDRGLHPNGRENPWKKAALTKAYRDTSTYLTRSAIARRVKDKDPFELPSEGSIPIHVTYHPKTNRRRDRDGAQASLKAALDGIADALRVNDTRFVVAPVEWGELKPPFGVVVVTIGDPT